MSLFCSLRLINDANASLSPGSRLLVPEELAKHIKYHSPRPVSDRNTLMVPRMETRHRSFSDYAEDSIGFGNNIN